MPRESNLAQQPATTQTAAFMHVEHQDRLTDFEMLRNIGWKAWFAPSPADTDKTLAIREKMLVVNDR